MSVGMVGEVRVAVTVAVHHDGDGRQALPEIGNAAAQGDALEELVEDDGRHE